MGLYWFRLRAVGFPLVLQQVQDERKTRRPPDEWKIRRPPYRHSRVSGNPEVPCHKPACLTQYRSGFPLTRE